MALSHCSNFGSFNHQQEYLTYPQAQTNQFATELLDFDDNFNYCSSDSFINPLFVFDELFYSDTSTNLLPYLSSPPENLISLSPDIFPTQELESYHYPKRQKSYSDDYNLSFATSFFDGNVGNFDPGTDYWPEIPAQVAKFEVSAISTCAEGMSRESNNVMKKASGGGGGLSAQSIAARERRRKITDKTQQLGKLIPGGNKMNTAEMLQAASNYVKFLQSQVNLLQLIQSAQERNKEGLLADELQILLASPAIQEKLYSQEKCLVPREFLETIANGDEIQSAPFINDEIHQLLGSN